MWCKKSITSQKAHGSQKQGEWRETHVNRWNEFCIVNTHKQRSMHRTSVMKCSLLWCAVEDDECKWTPWFPCHCFLCTHWFIIHGEAHTHLQAHQNCFPQVLDKSLPPREGRHLMFVTVPQKEQWPRKCLVHLEVEKGGSTGWQRGTGD